MPRSQEFQSKNESEKQLEFSQAEKDRLQDQIERSKERERSKEASSSEKLDDAKNEALELASSSEKVAEKKSEKAEETPEKRKKISKKDKEAAVEKTLKTIQSEMSAPARNFSKLIHAKPVEAVSEVAGKTIARPNALLFGGLSACILVLGTYLVAKHFGYPLSGGESFVAFCFGWIVGIIIDYVRIAATGGRQG